LSVSSDEKDTPSPKKTLLDFTAQISDDDSVASGNDSAGWEREEARVLNAFILQVEADDRLEDVSVNAPVKEVHEFMLMDEGEEGNAYGEVPCPLAALPEFETRQFSVKKTNIKSLKDIALMLHLAMTCIKQVLLNHICDSPHMTKLSADEFKYRHVKVAGQKIPSWVLFTPKDVPSVDGIDMGTGAEKGFFGPTNKESAIGGKRSNFMIGEKVNQPIFGPKKPGKKRMETDNQPPTPVQEDGHPSDAYQKKLPPLSQARPKDFFDTQITPEFIDWAVTATKLRAYTNGARSVEYTVFVPFDCTEIYKMIGVLFANGLTPKPQFDYWFFSEDQEPLFGSNLITNTLSWKNATTGKTIKAVCHWKHFCRYFTVADYRESPKEKQKANPLWKVQELLDKLNKQAKDMWVPRKFVAIDEQTIGFQGTSGMKLRISYKHKGGRFQCDAVCNARYMCLFYFQHGPPPNVGDQFKHLELSPMARQIVWLASHLPNSWMRIFMDNLFNSQTLFTALHICKTLGHSVACINGPGIPPSIIQKEEKNVARAQQLRGTTKTAMLYNSNDCPQLFAVLVYGMKPVHNLSTAVDCVEWILKERKVWSDSKQMKTIMKYLCLNVIKDYNNHMNSTDIADQLRGNYWPDRWMG
jgi:hypothetical protein